MATKHPRLNVTLDAQQMRLLVGLAEKENKSLSATAKELIVQALELHEDLTLSRLAAKRDHAKTKWVPHDRAWQD